MKNQPFFPLATIFAIALTFFACSSESDSPSKPPPEEPSSSSADKPSSSSVAPSSSSATLSSSSVAVPSSSSTVPSSSSSAVTGGGLCDGFTEGTTRTHYEKSKAQFCDSRDGKKYVYVQIGTQTWMAENLNYNAEDSKCFNDDPVNCAEYGRLYNWATAMEACPDGWHLPSNDEWTTLITYAGGTTTKLKATSGWKSNGNSTDEFGFAALPGGYSSGNSSFYIGTRGYWYNATEDENNSDRAYLQIMDSELGNAIGSYLNKVIMASVRCLHD